MKKTNKGITLVALIITIIILLILAGVTIAQLTGNGLFEKAKLAKEKTEKEQELENQTISEYEKLISQYVSNSREVGEMTTEELKNLIEGIVEAKIQTSSNGDTNPIGTVISYMGNNAPTGYLFCDGSEFNISEYKGLAEQIKSEFGSYNYFGGDGQTTFAVPNLKVEFLRGTGINSHSNQGSGASVGVHQDATNNLNFFIGSVYEIWIDSDKQNGTQNIDSAINFNNSVGRRNYFSRNSVSNDNVKYGDNGTYYTSRPTNTSVLYCIKY